jgi:hypothetical protein
LTEERLMEKSRAAWDLGHSALVDGLDYLPSEIFGVGFHRFMIACGSSVLIYAVGARSSAIRGGLERIFIRLSTLLKWLR